MSGLGWELFREAAADARNTSAASLKSGLGRWRSRMRIGFSGRCGLAQRMGADEPQNPHGEIETDAV